MKKCTAWLKARAAGLKRDIPAVYLALRRKDTPAAAKICALLVVVYALSPIDLIPDFIPILGYLDDLLLLPALIALTLRLLPPDTLAECRKTAEASAQSLQKNWLCALPFLLLWTLLLLWIGKVIFQ